MESWAKGVNLWLAAGASLYWTSYAFRLMGPAPAYAAAVGPNAPVVANVFMLLWVVLSCAALRMWNVRRTRRAIATSMIAASSIVLACDIALVAPPMPIALALLCLDYFTLGANMVLWGMAFASLEKRRAANHVILAVVFATSLILIGYVVSAFVNLPHITDVCSILSAAIMLNGRVTLQNQRRRPQPRPHRALGILFLQRLAYGFPIGFFPLLIGPSSLAGFDGALVAFALAALGVSAFATMHLGVPPYTTLPALLPITAAALCFPNMRGGAAAMLPLFLSGIWLAWQTFSSVQLSDLKDRLGLSELGISLADKVAIGACALLGSAARWVVELIVGGEALSPGTVESSLPMTFFALVLASTFSLARLVGVHQEDAFRSRAFQVNAEHEERAFAAIAARYGLSPRERQVFEVLTQGYTSSFVADETGITHGTVKAHVAHIYRKLGVHNRDEMLQLVEDYMAQP